MLVGQQTMNARYSKQRHSLRRISLVMCILLVAANAWAVPVPDDGQNLVCANNFKDPSSVPLDFRSGMQEYNLRRWADAVDMMDRALDQSPEDCEFVNTSGTWNAPYLPNLFAGIALCALQELDDGRDRAAETLEKFDRVPDRVLRDYENRCRPGDPDTEENR